MLLILAQKDPQSSNIRFCDIKRHEYRQTCSRITTGTSFVSFHFLLAAKYFVISITSTLFGTEILFGMSNKITFLSSTSKPDKIRELWQLRPATQKRLGTSDLQQNETGHLPCNLLASSLVNSKLASLL